MKLAVRYGKGAESKQMKLGEGLVGWAALHKEPVLVADVSTDPRYVNLVDDARSELVIPMLIKDRCIGVFDLESPELERLHQGTQGAAHAARQPGRGRDRQRAPVRRGAAQRGADRKGAAVRAARADGAAADRACPRRVDGVDVAGRFEPARELGGDLHDFLVPEADTLVVAVGDVSGKGAPAALYGAFAAELVRSRTLRRRFTPDRFSVAGVLQAMNTTLHDRQLEEYYCTLCYAFFDLQQRVLTMSNSGLPYPLYCSDRECRQIELPGVPLGSFPGVTYDEVEISAEARMTCSCSAPTGIFEAMNPEGTEFGAATAVGRRALTTATHPRARSSTRSSRPSTSSPAPARTSTT